MNGRASSQLVLAAGTAVSLTFGIHAVAPTLPLVQDVFGIDDFQVGLVTSVYVLPGVLLGVPLGVMADIIGRRVVFASAGLLYAAMGFAQATASSFEWLLVWRTVQGVAFAAIMPLTVTLIGDAYAGLAQVRAQATRQVSMATANLVVPMIGAQLALMAWYLPFAVQGILVFPSIAALFMLQGGRPEGPVRSGYLRDAVAAVRRPGFRSVLSLGFIRFFARFTALAYVPLDLVRRLDMSLSQVGLVMGLTAGLGFTSALLAGRLAGRARPSRLMAGALVSVSLGLVGFATANGLAWALAAAVIFALGDGLVAVVQSAYAARGAPDHVRAGLVALNGTARNAGKFVAPLMAGLIASWTSIGVALIAAAVFVVGIGLLVPAGLSHLDGLLRDEEVPSDAA
ncbi:MAG TPA: MFS transporter [Acidimicrobiia bacterium]|nr:MFS transporter [Acidimicrobiia bacterium]